MPILVFCNRTICIGEFVVYFHNRYTISAMLHRSMTKAFMTVKSEYDLFDHSVVIKSLPQFAKCAAMTAQTKCPSSIIQRGPHYRYEDLVFASTTIVSGRTF